MLTSSWECENITDHILDQYETIQYVVIYLQQTRENNPKVHKMTANKKDIDCCFFAQTQFRCQIRNLY